MPAPSEDASEYFDTYLRDGAFGGDLSAEGEPLLQADRGTVSIPVRGAAEGPGDGEDPGGDETGSDDELAGDESAGDEPAAFQLAADEMPDGIDPGDDRGDDAGDNADNDADDGFGNDVGHDADADADNKVPMQVLGREPGPLEVAGSDAWELVAATTTDENGAYSFEGLPTSDSTGNAWAYRVVTDRPAEAQFVPAHAAGDDNHDSDIAALDGNEEVGATDELSVVVVRSTGVNAYGQTWELHRPQHWTVDAERSVDIGWHWDTPDEPPALDDDDWITRILRLRLPQTSDMLFLGLVLLPILLSLALLLAARRHRIKEEG